VSTSTRWLVGTGVVLAALVAGALLLTVVMGGETVYPEGTPERVVQEYLHAVSDREVGPATSFLTDELAARCATTYRDPIVNRTASLRATLDKATTRGDSAEVHVRITETYGSGPFGSNESTQTVVFMLTKVTDAWRISESPWPLYCPEPARLEPAPR